MPLPLTRALEAVLAREDPAELRRATGRLIEVYRSGAPPTEPVLRDPVSAAAYAAYRMPATYAAVSLTLRLGLHADREALAGVRSLVDRGGGTGAESGSTRELPDNFFGRSCPRATRTSDWGRGRETSTGTASPTS